jgi:hypothetical protein
MREDPLVEEVRSARQKIFEACHEDLDALLDRFQEEEKQDRERLVSETATPPQQDPRKRNRVRP